MMHLFMFSFIFVSKFSHILLRTICAFIFVSNLCFYFCEQFVVPKAASPGSCNRAWFGTGGGSIGIFMCNLYSSDLRNLPIYTCEQFVLYICEQFVPYIFVSNLSHIHLWAICPIYICEQFVPLPNRLLHKLLTNILDKLLTNI